MNDRTKVLIEEARKLSPAERIQLVEDILVTVHEEQGGAIDTEWQVELERRMDAFDRGETQAIDADEVMAEARRRLRKR